MALAGLTNSIFVFFIAMIVLGAASGLEGPSLSSYAVAHAPGGRFGPTTGAMRFVGDLGFVVGPVMFGVLVDNTTWGYRGALLVTAAILVVIAALFASFAKESR